MAIDPTTEEVFPLQDAPKHIKTPKKIHINTPGRWAREGRLASDGVTRIKLETILLGGIRYTSASALQRFFAAQNAADTAANGTVSPQQRQRQSTAARQELAAMGIGGK